MKVVVHRFFINDDLVASSAKKWYHDKSNQEHYQIWCDTESGQWVKSVTDSIYLLHQRQFLSYEIECVIVADLPEELVSYFYLKWGQI